jgi:hypothetical protein
MAMYVERGEVRVDAMSYSGVRKAVDQWLAGHALPEDNYEWTEDGHLAVAQPPEGREDNLVQVGDYLVVRSIPPAEPFSQNDEGQSVPNPETRELVVVPQDEFVAKYRRV